MEEPESKQIKSNKEVALERMRNRYSDKNFDEEEAFFGQINDDYDDYDKKLTEYAGREKTFSDMFSSDPRSAAFITNWRKGDDPAVSLIRQFGTDIKDAIDDPKRQEEIASANKEFVDRVAKEKALEEEYQVNLEESLKTIESMQAKSGISDDDMDKAMEFLIGIMRDGIVGKFSPESIDMSIKAINYEQAVGSAEYEGEVKGRNAKIQDRLRLKTKGDGTAQLDGSNGKVDGAQKKRYLGALDRYDDGNLSIWERGGEKRTKAVL